MIILFVVSLACCEVCVRCCCTLFYSSRFTLSALMVVFLLFHAEEGRKVYLKHWRQNIFSNVMRFKRWRTWRIEFFWIMSIISCRAMSTLVPEVFLQWYFTAWESCERAAKRQKRVAKRRERKTSGYFGLESHFHADASCQTCQFDTSKRDQWKLSNHVLISRKCFHSGGEKWYLLTYLVGVNVRVCQNAFIRNDRESYLLAKHITKQVSPLFV